MTAASGSMQRTRSLNDAVGISPAHAIYIFTWALLSIAAGYRWFGVGVDYPEYREWWDGLLSWDSVREGRFELLFASLGLIFKRAGFSLGAYYASLIAVALGIKFTLIYRHTRWPLLALASYVAIFYFLHEYTQVRAAVAIAFGLLATFAWTRRNYVSAAAWLVLGATFQSSVLALGVGFVFAVSLSNAWAMVGWGVVAAAAAYVASTIDPVSVLVAFNPLVESYITTADTYEPPNIYSPQNVLLVAAIGASAVAALRDREPVYRLSLAMCVLALVAFFLFYSVPAIGNRLFGLFFVFAVFLSFQSRRFDMAALAGPATLVSAAWALRNAFDQKLIG